MTAPASIGAAFVASFALGLLAPAVAAQEPGARLTGLLLSEGDGAPVDGAVVSLVDGDDVVLWETLSNASGAFSLPLPPPGTYRARVTRIGYESWTSDPIRIDSAQVPGPLHLEVPVRAIPLPELMVTEQTDCPTTPEERRRAFELYESVLPVLDSMSTADNRDSLLVRLERPIKIWNRGGFRYRRDTLTVMVSEVLPNASPVHLEVYGYGDLVGDSMTTFYAPDGAALASPGFLATHCLSTAEAGTRAEITVGLAFGRAGVSRPQVSARTVAAVTAGLTFEPRPGREVVDVMGVLWIDTVANEPLELEFNYTSLRPFLEQHLVPLLRADIEARFLGHRASISAIQVQESLFGGHLRFERVAGDRWLIREWRILRPRLSFRLNAGAHIGISVWPIPHPLAYSGEVLALFRRTDRSPR